MKEMNPKNEIPVPDDQGSAMDGNESPMDSIIGRIDSYIKNPRLVTPETLTELKGELEDLRGFMDAPGDDAADEPISGNGKDRPGLTIMIGKMAKHGMKVFLLMYLLSFAKNLQAALPNPERLPKVNSHVSEAVNYSTGTTTVGSLVVSTYSFSIGSLIILSTGSTDAKIEIFDTSVSTTAAGAIELVPDVSTWDTGFTINPFNVTTSSGLIVYNQGTTPARIAIIGRQK